MQSFHTFFFHGCLWAFSWTCLRLIKTIKITGYTWGRIFFFLNYACPHLPHETCILPVKIYKSIQCLNFKTNVVKVLMAYLEAAKNIVASVLL